jgi:signal transduction histidine kinase
MSNHQKIKILLVDDLKDNLLALEGLLRNDFLEVFQATGGTEALELMMVNDFAVALIDVQMPVMDGFELAELMRSTKRTRSIPIIFVTAATEQSFGFKGYESGAVDFLLKPLNSHAVKSKVGIFVDLYRQKFELKTQLEEIEKIKKQLEDSLRLRDEFMSVASHELKTPLTSLTLQSQLRKRNLLKGDSTLFSLERLGKMFDSDEKQIKRITHLIDDMLDVTRINSGKLTMNFEKFDLCEMVRELVERNNDLFLASGCILTCNYCEPAVGNWDRFRIEQVVTNLLTNAMRYGSGSPISVTVKRTKMGCQVSVKDFGRGIAPESHGRIFERFERAESSGHIAGLGLGLYIVKQIVEAHHGKISLESELGKGASFTVELPI